MGAAPTSPMSTQGQRTDPMQSTLASQADVVMTSKNNATCLIVDLSGARLIVASFASRAERARNIVARWLRDGE